MEGEDWEHLYAQPFDSKLTSQRTEQPTLATDNSPQVALPEANQH